MLPMLPSLRRAQEESEAVADSVPVLSQKGAGKLQNHLQNCASRTRYLEASDMEPARTCLSMNTVKPNVAKERNVRIVRTPKGAREGGWVVRWSGGGSRDFSNDGRRREAAARGE